MSFFDVGPHTFNHWDSFFERNEVKDAAHTGAISIIETKLSAVTIAILTNILPESKESLLCF